MKAPYKNVLSVLFSRLPKITRTHVMYAAPSVLSLQAYVSATVYNCVLVIFLIWNSVFLYTL